MATSARRDAYQEAMITACSYPENSRERMLGIWWANEVHRMMFPFVITPLQDHGVSHRFEEIVHRAMVGA